MIVKKEDDRLLFEILDSEQEIKFELHHKDGKTVNVTLEGNGVYCKDIRDIIVLNEGWSQGRLSRKEIGD